MSSIRKICAVSGTRADFGLLRWTMEAIGRHPGLALQLVLTGSHLDPAFGNTRGEIDGLGLEVADSVPLAALGAAPGDIARAIGQATLGLARAFERLQPDMLLILGDRYEILAAAQAAMACGIPICHLHGGEATEGLIDEAVRHAVTKMAHVHCVAAEPYARRVRQLGEDPDNVHIVGAAGLDAIAQLSLLDRPALQSALGYPLRGRHFLVTYHPVTLQRRAADAELAPLLDALDGLADATVTITGANADAGGNALNELLQAHAARRPHVHFVHSLGQLRYLSLAALSAAVVGNSSSGLIEVPALGVPTVNIGPRQQNRLRAASVIDCDNSAAAIGAALHTAAGEEMRATAARCDNPYGSPGAAGRIVHILAGQSLDGILMKRFHDWPEPTA